MWHAAPMGRSTGGRSRWPALVAVLLVVLVGVWVARFVWAPSFRPGLNDGEAYGVDVSNHQGEIDWARVARDDIEFAYIKATEGGDFVDEWFAENWAGAGEVGLARGAYHFFTLCTPGADQARNFLDTVPIDDTMLAPALDLEFAGNCSERPSQAWVEAEVAAWISAVEAATNQRVVLYIGGKWEDAYGTGTSFDRPRWLRRILRRPGGDWVAWQFSYFGDVDGIDGGVDLNVGRLAEPAVEG